MLLAGVLVVAAAAAAHAELNVGGGASFETGRPPISPVIPQFFVQVIYRVAPWQTFGLDLAVAVSPFQNGSFDNGVAAGPLVGFGADAAYMFPRIGVVEPAVLIGGWGFNDYHNRVNGSVAQAGVAATMQVGGFFIQGRALYRFFSTAGAGYAPDPLGLLSFALLGGITL